MNSCPFLHSDYKIKLDKTSWTYNDCNSPDLPGLKGEMFIVQTFVGDNLSSLGPDKRAIYICILLEPSEERNDRSRRKNKLMLQKVLNFMINQIFFSIL